MAAWNPVQKQAVVALFVFVALAITLYVGNNSDGFPFEAMVFVLGCTGAVLREMITIAWALPRTDTPQPRPTLVFALSPVVGGVLALILVALVAGSWLEGSLLPKFKGVDREFANVKGAFQALSPATNADFFKACGLAVLSGMSERWVVDRVEGLSKAIKGSGLP